MMLMRTFALLLLASAVFGAAPEEIAYDSAPDFLKLPPGMNLGEASGVAVNSKKHVFVFSRSNTSGPAYGAAASQLLEFAPDGKFIREIGKNLYAWSFAHDVRVDKDDNIWAIDKGSDMIVKFNPEGRVVMVFGRKKEASDEAGAWTRVNPPRPAIDGQFRQPTDVTWDNDGNIYISDGYINSRIAKYDKNGDWVKSWGQPGSKPGEFNIPHGIAADAKGNVYVADRQNKRIQVFDGDGKFLREWKIDLPAPAGAKPWMATVAEGQPVAPNHTPGAPWTVCITPGATQYLYTSDSFPGRIYKFTLDGQLVGYLGSAGRQLKQFGWIHQMACPSENELYVAEVVNWRVQKLTLHPKK
jgi:DNA-binding beta-propeller fold protein YncE